MDDLEDGGLVLRMVKQKREGAWVSNDHVSMDCSPLLFSIREKGNPLCATKRNHSDSPPQPYCPFRYFLEVHFNPNLNYYRTRATAEFCTRPLSSLFLGRPDYSDVPGLTHQIHSG